MATPHTDPTEHLVRFSRRQLWLALAFLLTLGAVYLAALLGHASVPLAAALPIAIVLMFALDMKKHGVDLSRANPALQALRNDELRQFAQARAFRNGFFVLLAYPPLCACALAASSIADPLPIVVETSAWIGAVTCLASLLWHDR